MLKILLLDDNPSYLSFLKFKLLEIDIPYKIVGCATANDDAYNIIMEEKPDVLILDIDLGIETAFELFNRIDFRDFEIIFASGHRDYAISAFDVEAIGFLVKPVITSQLEKFLLVAKNNIEARLPPQAVEKMVVDALPYSKSEFTISVPSEIGFDVVAISSILRLEAINTTTQIFLVDGKKIVGSYNLGKFSDLLSSKGFYAPHRSHVVNLSYVKKYLRSGIIIMEDSKEVPLSLNKRKEFISIFSS